MRMDSWIFDWFTLSLAITWTVAGFLLLFVGWIGLPRHPEQPKTGSSRRRASPGLRVAGGAFLAAAATVAGSYTGYSWTFGGDPGTGAGPDSDFEFSTPGIYPVSVRVTDSNGVSASASVSVKITNLAVTEIDRPTQGITGAALTLSANATGGAGGPYNYTWNFGDGTAAYGATGHHSYGSTGTFVPTVTVRDRPGATNVSTCPSVTVSTPPGPLSWLPLWVLAAAGAAAGAAVALGNWAASASSDQSGLESMSRWVPPVGPKGALQGSKVCPKCGAPNPPVRRSCQVCGAALPRSPQG